MKISRRALLKTPLIAAIPAAGCSTRIANVERVDQVLKDATSLLVESYPETASSAGIDKGEYAHLKSRLSDRSIAGQDEIKRNVIAMLAKLQNVDKNELSSAQALDLNVVTTVFNMAVEGFEQPYGDMALLNHNWSYRNSPYAVTQNTGAFVEIPTFLDSSHSINNGDDADAYLLRMSAFAAQLDGETERVIADAKKNAILPDFLMQKTLNQLSETLKRNASSWGLVSSIVDKSSALGNDYQRNAEQIAEQEVRPAISRQLEALKSLAPQTNGDAGVWSIPDGDEYYAWALKAGTTTNMTADEVHQMGLDELASLHGRMDPILRSLGYTKGAIGERMVALAQDTRFHFSAGDKGRQEIMQFIHSTVDDIRARMPQAFETLVPGFLEVTRISPEVEDGAPGAYGGAGSIDGTKPGHFWINLRTPSLHNKYTLPDLTYHEAIPGHVWQGEYTFKQSAIRSMLAFNAYSEGWALYAEQIADELGVYQESPAGQLGYLQSLAFRACRLVVDTGLHEKRWTREQAINWFVTNNGSNPDEVQSEVDRYCAWPGQACGYKVGHTAIVELRSKAKKALGAKFDFRRFNDAVVLSGAVPITVLESIIDEYIRRDS